MHSRGHVSLPRGVDVFRYRSALSHQKPRAQQEGVSPGLLCRRGWQEQTDGGSGLERAVSRSTVQTSAAFPWCVLSSWGAGCAVPTVPAGAFESEREDAGTGK